MGPDLGPAVGGLVDSIKADMIAKDSIAIRKAVVKGVGMGSEAHEMARGAGAGSMEAGAEETRFRRNRPMMDMKAAAVQALGALAAHTGSKFAPHMQRVRAMLLTVFNHENEKLRSQAALSMGYVMVSMAKNGGTSPPSSSGGVPAMRPEFKKILAETNFTMLQCFSNDVDESSAASFLEYFIVLMNKLGVWALGPQLKPLLLAIGTGFEGKLTCVADLEHQTGADEYDDDGEGERGGSAGGDEEDGDLEMDRYQPIITNALVDFLEAFIQAGKATAFDQIVASGVWEHFAQYFKYEMAPGDLATPMGTIGIFAEEAGPKFASKFGDIMPVIVKAVRDNSPDLHLQRNLAFVLGALPLVHHATGERIVGEAVKYCLPRCRRPADAIVENHAIADNSMWAILRLAKAFPGKCNVDEIVSASIASLPIKEDYSESGNILGTLLQMVAEGQPKAVAGLPKILTECARTLSGSIDVESAPEKALIQVMEAVNGIMNSPKKDMAMKAIESCPDMVKQVLRTRLQAVGSHGLAKSATMPISPVRTAGSPRA